MGTVAGEEDFPAEFPAAALTPAAPGAASAVSELSIPLASLAQLTTIVEACVSLIRAQRRSMFRPVDRPLLRVRSAGRIIPRRANHEHPRSDRASIASLVTLPNVTTPTGIPTGIDVTLTLITIASLSLSMASGVAWIMDSSRGTT